MERKYSFTISHIPAAIIVALVFGGIFGVFVGAAYRAFMWVTQ